MMKKLIKAVRKQNQRSEQICNDFDRMQEKVLRNNIQLSFDKR